MLFAISLLSALFAVSLSQEEDPSKIVRCRDKNDSITQDVPFRLLNGGPGVSNNYWESTINLLSFPQRSRSFRVSFHFDDSVEIIIDDRGEKINVFQEARSTPYTYVYSGTKIDLLQINVRSLSGNTFPYLTQFSINDEDVCSRLQELPLQVSYISPPRSSAPLPDNKFLNDDIYTQCGKRKKDHVGLIKNSYATNAGDWPWHAALYHVVKVSLIYQCGGSLITGNVVLTAAHCLFEQTSPVISRRLKVRLGLYNRLRVDSNVQEFDVHQIVRHSNFTLETYHNDIALLQLATDPEFNNYVQTVCLWKRELVNIRESEGKAGYVVGWGTNEQNIEVHELAEARMPVVSHNDCLDSNYLFYSRFLSGKTFCAGYRNGTSACNGDSGGGLHFKDDNGIFHVRGIVSVSMSLENGLCNAHQYIIFTDVGRYLDWIDNAIAESFEN